MLVQDIITKSATAMYLDTDDYDVQDMIRLINDGLDFITDTLTAGNDPDVLNSITVTGTTSVPTNFLHFVPQNGYPLKVVGNTITLLAGTTATALYAASKTHVTAIGDTIPVADYYTGILIDYVCVRYQNGIEMNVEQDLTLLKSNLEARIKAKGA